MQTILLEKGLQMTNAKTEWESIKVAIDEALLRAKIEGMEICEKIALDAEKNKWQQIQNTIKPNGNFELINIAQAIRTKIEELNEHEKDR